MRFNEYKKDERMNMVLWTVLLLIVVVACMFSKEKMCLLIKKTQLAISLELG